MIQVPTWFLTCLQLLCYQRNYIYEVVLEDLQDRIVLIFKIRSQLMAVVNKFSFDTDYSNEIEFANFEFDGHQ